MENTKIYESKHHDFQPIKQEDVEFVKASRSVWKQDPNGYFLIRIQDGRIEAGFCTNDNKLVKTFYAETAEPIYESINRENLVSLFDHASYLGRELKKAEIALKLKLKYVQDDPLVFDKGE